MFLLSRITFLLDLADIFLQECALLCFYGFRQTVKMLHFIDFKEAKHSIDGEKLFYEFKIVNDMAAVK